MFWKMTFNTQHLQENTSKFSGSYVLKWTQLSNDNWKFSINPSRRSQHRLHVISIQYYKPGTFVFTFVDADFLCQRDSSLLSKLFSRLNAFDDKRQR